MNKLRVFNNFKPKLIPKSKLFNYDLNSAIAHSKYVFIGEIHGAKENCDVLYSLIRHYKIKNLALELDIELKPFVDSCINGKPNFELINEEYFISSVLPIEQAKTIHLLIKAGWLERIMYFGNGEELDVAEDILKLKARGPIFCLRGNWHTLPYLYSNPTKQEHKSSYLYVKQKQPSTVNIMYKYQSGEIYNIGTGIMSFDDTKSPKNEYDIIKINKYPDYFELIIPSASPIAH